MYLDILFRVIHLIYVNHFRRVIIEKASDMFKSIFSTKREGISMTVPLKQLLELYSVYGPLHSTFGIQDNPLAHISSPSKKAKSGTLKYMGVVRLFLESVKNS